MTEMIGRPAYQQVADDLRKRISDGAIPVGEAIPSAAKLKDRYAVSSTVIQRAINELRAEGLLVGQPGKAVFVKATPEAVANDTVNLQELAGQVAVLRSGLQGLDGASSPADIAGLRTEVEELRRQIALVQAHLIDLYGRVGQPYPRDLSNSPAGAETPRRKRGAA